MDEAHYRRVWALLSVGVVASALVLLWSFSRPSPSWGALLGLLVLLVLCVPVWVIATSVLGIRLDRWTWWSVTAPVVAVVLLVCVCTGAPLRARWAASRGGFEAVVASLPVRSQVDVDGVGDRYKGPAVDVPSRIGAYAVREATLERCGVVFVDGSDDDSGFAYLPTGECPATGPHAGWFDGLRFTHLDGSWYTWHQSA